jgi:hypothetical protein
MIKFGALRREDMPLIWQWRNQTPEAWRDPRPTTITQQYDWFDKVVSHNPNGRYWGIYLDDKLVGQVELTSIIWEYGTAEIGLIINIDYWSNGIGSAAVKFALEMGFNYLGLQTIYGESYKCAAADFWEKRAKKWGGYTTTLPLRKRTYDGELWDILYFSWARDDWNILNDR